MTGIRHDRARLDPEAWESRRIEEYPRLRGAVDRVWDLIHQTDGDTVAKTAIRHALEDQP